MTNEFKKISQGDVTRYVLENASGGGTSAGSVASVSMPIGGMQRRKGDNLIAQEGDKKKVPASTPRNFVAKNAKTAGAGAHKDKSKTIPRKEKHKKPFMEDHSTATGGWGQGSYDTYTAGNHGRGVAENPEWYSDEANSMSSSQLKSLYKHAMKLRQAVKQMQAQGDTLEPWQQSKVTKAADYLDAVFNAVDDEHDMGEEQGMAEGERMMEIKQRLDAKCWKGKHKEGTKIKGGVRVNNCVPNESVDPYFESLQQMVERQLEPTMDLDTWVDNFQNADPNKYHQFKNKTPEKKK